MSVSALPVTSSPSLASLLSVLLVTSPISLHPSTEVIDQTLDSLLTIPELLPCPTLIICDGVRIASPPSSNNLFKQGIVTPHTAALYAQYKATLAQRYASHPTIRVHALSERHGFGFAVRAGLHVVTTPFVLVLQHDYVFVRAAPIDRLVRLMAIRPVGELPINYVGFLSRPTLNYFAHSKSHYRMIHNPAHRLHSFSTTTTASSSSSSSCPSSSSSQSADETPLILCPLMFWYCSPPTHAHSPVSCPAECD